MEQNKNETLESFFIEKYKKMEKNHEDMSAKFVEISNLNKDLNERNIYLENMLKVLGNRMNCEIIENPELNRNNIRIFETLIIDNTKKKERYYQKNNSEDAVILSFILMYMKNNLTENQLNGLYEIKTGGK